MNHTKRREWLGLGVFAVATVLAFVSELRSLSDGPAGWTAAAAFAVLAALVPSIAVARRHLASGMALGPAVARLRRSIAVGVFGGLVLAFVSWVTAKVFGAGTTVASLGMAFQIAVSGTAISALMSLRRIAPAARGAAALLALGVVAGAAASLLSIVATPNGSGIVALAVGGAALGFGVLGFFSIVFVVRQVALGSSRADEALGSARRSMELLGATLACAGIAVALLSAGQLVALLASLLAVGLAIGALLSFDSACVAIEEGLERSAPEAPPATPA